MEEHNSENNHSFLDSYLNRILFVVLVFLCVIIVLTTLVTLTKKNDKSVPSNGKTSSQNLQQNNYSVFSGLSRLRAVTSDGVTLVVSPFLSYTKDDVQFYEELTQKTPALKNIMLDYFSKKSKEELKSQSEENIKKELCNELNKNLSLNKIKSVYFSEYIFLD